DTHDLVIHDLLDGRVSKVNLPAVDLQDRLETGKLEQRLLLDHIRRTDADILHEIEQIFCFLDVYPREPGLNEAGPRPQITKSLGDFCLRPIDSWGAPKMPDRDLIRSQSRTEEPQCQNTAGNSLPNSAKKPSRWSSKAHSPPPGSPAS